MSAPVSPSYRSTTHIGPQITSEFCFVGAACALLKFFDAYSNYISGNNSLSSLPISVSTDSRLVQEGYNVIFPLAIAALATLTGLYMRSYARDLAKRNL